jgi:hypothetical protein
MTQSRTSRFLLIVIGLFLLYATGIFVRERYGVGVVIRNDSEETLRQVSVKVESLGDRGQRHSLPDLAPGDWQRVFVQAVTESHIKLESTDSRGKLHVETVVGYSESGYCGTASAIVLTGDGFDTIPTFNASKSWLDFIS